MIESIGNFTTFAKNNGSAQQKHCCFTQQNFADYKYSKHMVKFKKKQTLRGQLRAMPIGEPAEISYRKTGYKAEIVRQAISRMKKEGYLFECTEKGLADTIRVTRLQ